MLDRTVKFWVSARSGGRAKRALNRKPRSSDQVSVSSLLPTGAEETDASGSIDDLLPVPPVAHGGGAQPAPPTPRPPEQPAEAEPARGDPGEVPSPLDPGPPPAPTSADGDPAEPISESDVGEIDRLHDEVERASEACERSLLGGKGRKALRSAMRAEEDSAVEVRLHLVRRVRLRHPFGRRLAPPIRGDLGARQCDRGNPERDDRARERSPDRCGPGDHGRRGLRARRAAGRA